MNKKLNILLVDDSEKITSLIKLTLLRYDTIKTIETTHTLLLAKEMLNKETIDAVILDMHLPDGNGISLLKWIKLNHSSTIVIMFSNHSDSFFRDAAAKAGAEYFLDKTTEFEQIPKIISELHKQQL